MSTRTLPPLMKALTARMTGTRTRALTGALTAALLLAPAAPLFAHSDEDHGDPKAAGAAKAPAAPGAVGATGAAGEAPRRLPDGSLFIPKSAQRQLGVRTVLTRVATLSAAVELNGTIIADPETSGRVQAPFAGTVQPGPRGMPVAGRRVARGEVLATLHPVASAIEQGNQKAQIADLDAQLAIAERKVERYAQLEGVIPQKEIDAARIERDSLRQRRSFVAASVDNAVPLRAPAGGIISASHHLFAGQIVDAREVLFEIVDPARLAVEALAYEPGIAATLQSASMRAGEASFPLTFVGGGRQLREQALPLLFRIVRPDATLAVGQRVKVVVRTGRGQPGVALPQAAVSTMPRPGPAAPTVWVHTEAERFIARPVRIAPLDAANVAVIEGLRAGERVVTEGASLLDQVR